MSQEICDGLYSEISTVYGIALRDTEALET